MPNPQLGAPGGYYVDSSQTMVYNGLQTSVRKRFSNHYSFDANYTFGKGTATQGGDLAAYSLATSTTRRISGTPSSTGAVDNDIRHRVNGCSSTNCQASREAEGSSTVFSAAGRSPAFSRPSQAAL